MNILIMLIFPLKFLYRPPGSILYFLSPSPPPRSLRQQSARSELFCLNKVSSDDLPGLFFRPASLYHPQRDAISHIKCQKEKVKGINTKEKMKQKKKNQMLNFSFLRVRKLRLLLVSISLASLGVYTPMFYVVSFC